jgi:transposase
MKIVNTIPMAKYKQSAQQSGIFTPVCLEKQLLPGTFEWTLDKLIDKADLSAFNAKYRNDNAGAAAYPPSVLLKAILFCYSHGVISSRHIADALKYNMVLKALCEDMEMEKSVIANFVSGNQKPIEDVFVKVLFECSQLGLIGGELFAVDGCKLPSNASKEWSGTLEDFRKKKAGWERLTRKLLDRQKSADREEKVEGLNGAARSLVEDEALAQRHIERLRKKTAKLDEYFETHKEDKRGANGHPIQNNITDEESAKIKGPHGAIQGYNGIAGADSRSQVIVAAEAFGSGPEARAFPGMLDKLNENMKRLTGKEKPLEHALVEADTGYFSEENLQAAQERGIEVLIPDQQFRNRDEQFAGQKGHIHDEHFTIDDFAYNKKDDTYTCPAGKTLDRKPNTTLRGKPMLKWSASVRDCRACPLADKCMKVRGNKRGSKKTLLLVDRQGKENLSEKMRDKIDSPVYRTLYGQRMQIIEPCFADITYCKGMNRFTLRGKAKVNSQWLLFCIVHNIGKCIAPLTRRYGF